MKIKVRALSGALVERELAPQYTMLQLVRGIDTALDRDVPMVIRLAVPADGSAPEELIMITPHETATIAVVE